MANCGLKNTLRFRWKKQDVPVMERRIFTKEVLMDFLRIKVEEIFCLQDNPRERVFRQQTETVAYHRAPTRPLKAAHCRAEW